MARAGVGLVLRSKTVEVVEVRRGVFGAVVTKHASAPISGTDDTYVAEAIRTALATAGIQETRVAVSVPAQDALLRSFSMLLLPKAERDTAVQFEVGKYLPFKTKDLAWRFHIEEERGAKQMRVVFVGVHAESFARIQGWLKDAQVEPVAVEAPAVGLARAVKGLSASAWPGLSVWGGVAGKRAASSSAFFKNALASLKGTRQAAPEPGEFLAVADIEPDAIHLVITKDQLPYFSRDLNLTAVVDAGDSTSEGPSVDPRAEALLNEVRLSFDFFTREHPSAIIRQLVLFGEEAAIRPWCDWLSSQLPCPVVLGKLPCRARADQPVSLQFACAVGVALRGIQPPKIELDLLKPPASETAATAKLDKLSPELLRSLAKPFAIQASLAMAALLVFALVEKQQVAATQQQIRRTVQAFPDVGWGLKEQSKTELETLQQRADERLSVLHDFIQRRIRVTEKLDVLAKILPEGVWFNKLSYRGPVVSEGKRSSQGSLVLDGACFLSEAGREMSAISDFVDRIKQEPRLLRGLADARLDQIMRVDDVSARVSYQQFRVRWESAERF